MDMGHSERILARQLTDVGNARGMEALTISIVFSSLATFFVVARFFTRGVLVQRIGYDDWTSLAALIFSLIFMGLFVGEKVNGLGNHITDIPPDMMTKMMICFWLSVPMYNSSLYCTKASIVLMYLRIFPGTTIRKVCYAMLSFLIAYGLWAVVSGYLNCIPVQKFWDDSLDGGCINMDKLWLSNAIMHIITDVTLLAMPMPIISTLQLPMRQKFAVMGIFALGGLLVPHLFPHLNKRSQSDKTVNTFSSVCITSGLRLHSLRIIGRSKDKTCKLQIFPHLERKEKAALTKLPILGDNVGAASWSAIECNVAIICSSLSTLRPLLAKIFPRIFSVSTMGYLSNRNTSHRSTWHNNGSKGGSKYGMQSFAQSKSTDEEGSGDSSRDLGGITVTKMVVQESVDIDDTASNRKLVYAR
ncbi:hypothetical protein FQN50_005802 [Emmonsiellopsis sp. PD_5]|nr:hypothetical protein FQN50_005802 [Emmonsiellopsis sp. PD_5]